MQEGFSSLIIVLFLKSQIKNIHDCPISDTVKHVIPTFNLLMLYLLKGWHCRCITPSSTPADIPHRPLTLGSVLLLSLEIILQTFYLLSHNFCLFVQLMIVFQEWGLHVRLTHTFVNPIENDVNVENVTQSNMRAPLYSQCMEIPSTTFQLFATCLWHFVDSKWL